MAGGDKSSQDRDIAHAKRLAAEYREQLHMASKAKKSRPFDAAKYLGNDEAIAAYITEALLTYEADTIARAIGVAAKARGMSHVAKHTGLSRESLYKALSGDGHPQFATINLVLKALGLRLRAEPADVDSKGKRAA